MKAIVYTEYGGPDVLHLAEVEKPVPGEKQILVRVHAAAVNYGDLLARNFKAATLRDFNMPNVLFPIVRMSFGSSRPRRQVLGSEFAGVVEAVGAAVSTFKPGDEVYGYLGQNMGAYAEYICVDADGSVARKPANLSFAEAATLPYGAIMAAGLLQRAPIQPGQKVLIVGASGSIGAAALQLAKAQGAEVTAVCGTASVDTVKALGADHVVDYRKEDFMQRDATYDLIFDILGRGDFNRSRALLTPNGRYLMASFKEGDLVRMLGSSFSGGPKLICALANETVESLHAARELVEAGTYRVEVDRVFPMEQAAEAHRYAESSERRGPVVIRLAEEAGSAPDEAGAQSAAQATSQAAVGASERM